MGKRLWNEWGSEMDRYAEMLHLFYEEYNAVVDEHFLLRAMVVHHS